MNFQTRLRYADAHLISLINYGMPLYVNENQEIKMKLHKCILRVGRWVHGNYCYKRSIKSIMEQLNWKIPEEQIEDSAARFFQKILVTKEPKDIHDLIRQPRTRRNVELTLKTIPKQKPFKNLMLNSMANMINRIQEDLKEERPHIFKKKLKKRSLKPNKN